METLLINFYPSVLRFVTLLSSLFCCAVSYLRSKLSLTLTLPLGDDLLLKSPFGF